MKKLSIIIPVYNVEKYVAKCIYSCLKQDLKKENYEIIIINDGTKDKSLEIINEIKFEYPELIVFSQENAGLSAARNKGLSIASGEYIWFIDSDDWIKENCLKAILAKLNGIDVLALGGINAYDNFQNNTFFYVSNKNASNGIDLLKSGFIQPAQFYIYKKSFLVNNRLFFLDGVFHEDFEFTPRMLYVAQKIGVYEIPVYFFYKREGSITNTVNTKRSHDLIKVAIKLKEFNENFVLKKYKHIFYNLIGLAINNSLFNTSKLDIKNQKELSVFYFNNRALFKDLQLSTVLKYKLEGFLFFLFPKKVINIYKMLKKNG
ncbi:glycosyltransferase family 2 protein [Lutibacter sp.]|uniref:glycosyltransferase family 2 protein n=1 Tax=Lutibacter sp. TaxID=1925666 RepID=UPI003566F97D